MTELNPPRGMRDIVNKEAELYEYLFQEFRETAKRRGFQPIITPIVEYFSLFEAKSGEEIKKSMYVFEDKAGRLLALRPEVTASIVRAYLKHMRGYPKPIRLYYIAQCYRYEEPQYARYREFWQGGLEVIGDADINSDILVAMTASEFLDRIGLKHYYEVGNVALYRVFMKKYGLGDELQDHVLHLIDKDIVDEALRILTEKIGDNVVVFKQILETVDLQKVESLIHENKEFLGELYELVLSEQRRLYEFISSLQELGYSVKYQPRLVRGLAYYTGLIFEYKIHGQKDFPSIGGGGRYDGLTTVYGGVFEHSTGLALGLDRIALALSNEMLLPRYKTIAVLVLGKTPISYGYSISRRILENTNSSVRVFVHKPRSLSRGLEYCNKTGVDIALIVGEREFADNKVLIKDMKKGTQEEVRVEDIPLYIKNIFEE